MMNLRLTEQRDVFGLLRAVHVGLIALTVCALLCWLQAKRRWNCRGIIAQVATTHSPPFFKSVFLSTTALLS